MYQLNGQKININMQLVIDGTQYPSGFFRDAAARESAGIVEVPDPIRPDERYYFITESSDGSLNIAPKPVDSVRTMVWEWIKTHRDALMEAGCEVGADWYHNDVKSRSQWERMVNRANTEAMSAPDAYLIGGQQVAWKTMDGTFVPLTAGIIRAVVAAFEMQEAAIFLAAEAHKQALWHPSRSVVDAIAAYDWKADWPAVYVPAVA